MLEPQHQATSRAFARWACDRHAGIGADGLLVLETSRSADVRMRTINADGSEAEMCGNGVRCAARWLDEAGEGERTALRDRGRDRSQTEIVARGPEYLVRVAMGTPRMSSFDVPGFSDDAASSISAIRTSSSFATTPARSISRPSRSGCRAIRAYPTGRTCTPLRSENSGGLRVRHWERGVGLTMACGTGAVACAAVAIARRRVVSPVSVEVPGGRLTVEWDGRGDAFLTGPAIRVFDTEVEFVAHRD